MSKAGHTLIVPFGLKSLLVVCGEAVLLEQPPNVTEFIASYCTQLLELKQEHPDFSITDLSTYLKESKGQTECQMIASFPCLADDVLIECSRPQTRQHFAESQLSPEAMSATMSQNPSTTCHLSKPDTHDPPTNSVTVSSAMHKGPNTHVLTDESSEHREELGPISLEKYEDRISEVQSAVFQRAPSVNDVDDLYGKALICASRAPSEDVIIVHSENLPEMLVFHSDAEAYASSVPECDLVSTAPLATVGQRFDKKDTEGASSVVIFNKVPSFENLSNPPVMEELLSSTGKTLVEPETKSSRDEDLLQDERRTHPYYQKDPILTATQEVGIPGKEESMGRTTTTKVHTVPLREERYPSSSVQEEQSHQMITKSAPSGKASAGAVRKVSSVRIPNREKTVEMSTEAPKKDTSSGIHSKVSPRVTPRSSSLSVVKLAVSGTSMVIHPGSTSLEMISQPLSAVACVQRVRDSVCQVDGQPCSNTSQGQTVNPRKVTLETYNRQSCLETEEGSLASFNRGHAFDVSQPMTHEAKMDYPSTCLERSFPPVTPRCSESNTSETAAVGGAENKTISSVVCACCSGSDLTESAECRASSVSREQSVRPAEAPQIHISPRVSSQTSIIRHEESMDRTKALHIFTPPGLNPQELLLSKQVSCLSDEIAGASASDVLVQTNSDIGMKGFVLGRAITAEKPTDNRQVRSELDKTQLFEILLQTHLDLEKEHMQGRAVTDVSAKAHCETAIIRSAQSVPPATVPSRRESVRRLAEALDRHLSSSVLPTVSTSEIGAIVEDMKATKMIPTATPHPGFPVNEKCSPSLTEEMERAMEVISLKLSKAIIDSVAHRVSTDRILNRQETVGTPAPIPDRQTAPRGAPLASSEIISGCKVLETQRIDELQSVQAVADSALKKVELVKQFTENSKKGPSGSSLLGPQNPHLKNVQTDILTEEITRKTQSVIREELATEIPGERAATPQFLCSVHSSDNQTQRGSIVRSQAASAIKMAISERNYLMKKLAQSGRQRQKLVAYQSSARCVKESNQEEVSNTRITWGVRGSSPYTTVLQALPKQGLDISAGEERQVPQVVTFGAGYKTPEAKLPLESSVNQVWTLYHLAPETEKGILSMKVLSESPFNGRAYIESVGPEHVTLAKITSQHSIVESSTRTSQPSRVTPLKQANPACTPNTQEIKIPNYFLVVEEGNKEKNDKITQTINLAYSPADRPFDQGSVSANSCCLSHLSFSVPLDGFWGAECGPLLLQVTSHEGQPIYSPAFIEAINPAMAGSEENRVRTNHQQPQLPINMEWSFKISIKGQEVRQECHQQK